MPAATATLASTFASPTSRPSTKYALIRRSSTASCTPSFSASQIRRCALKVFVVRLAKIEKKRPASSADVGETAPDQPFARERLAA
jgi:hypothetical protein